MKKRKILIVDDDPSFNEMLSRYLLKNNFAIESVHSAGAALRLLKNQKFDLVITDLRLPKMNGLELIEKIKKEKPKTPVILVTNYSDIRTAVKSIKLGCYEFISKPIIPDELLKIINKALENRLSDGKNTTTLNQTSNDSISYVKGKSPLNQELWKQVDIVAQTKMSVLIIGESGTGKENIARKIHEKSKRSNQPFVAIDCGVLSKDLATSELFGHKKGAFTGALVDKTGQFELANKGTLFLDEIGNLSLEVQTQLLRALQEKTIRKIGDEKEIQIDVRIIAATNEKLAKSIDKGSFRNDLYHRINEFEIYVPSLKERIEDIEDYIEFFLKEANEEMGKKVNHINKDVLDVFKSYKWSGNLRELKNIVKRAVLLSDSSTIELANLPFGFAQNAENESRDNSIKKRELNLKELQENQEKEAIREALIEFKYNKSKAADALNIDRTTLYKKIKLYQIDS